MRDVNGFVNFRNFRSKRGKEKLKIKQTLFKLTNVNNTKNTLRKKDYYISVSVSNVSTSVIMFI